MTLGIRHWYPGKHQGEETRRMLATLERHQDDEALLERVSHHQVQIGRLLQAHGLVPASLFNQAMIDYDADRGSLGEHLVERGMITAEVLQQALADQAEEQQAAYSIVAQVTP